MNLPLSGPATVVHWCSLCNAAPAEGILTILRKGEMLTEDIKACSKCVKELNEDQWLDERTLS